MKSLLASIESASGRGVAASQVIKAAEKNLVAVFGDQYLFHVPLYQRPYAWTTEQVDELLDDLLDAMKRDPTAPYFLGSIVLIKKEKVPKSAVVDGQQRLTTLTMILCVLRGLIDNSERKLELDEFIRQKGSAIKGIPDQFRLRLRDRDQPFFENYVQANDNIEQLAAEDRSDFTDIQERIVDNVDRIVRTLELLPDAEQIKFATFIVRHCYLVVVTATDRDSAYRTFSVMNDRGLDLSPTDILKAETIGRIQESDQASYGEDWENTEERLGRGNFRDLFTHIRMIHLKTKMRQTLQADFLDHILTTSTGQGFIKETLIPYARVYETVRFASYESTHYAEEVNKYLTYLRRLDNSDWMPPAMAFFHRNAGDYRQVVTFAKDLERLAYGLFIIRANVNTRIKRYAQLLNAIEGGSDLSHPDSPLQLCASEKESILRRLDGDVYRWVAIARRVLLLRLDSLVAESNSGATYDRRIVTVEHVLPQNPMEDSEWTEWFPDEEERCEWTHKLANLVILSRRKNSRASNWAFQRKKTVYFQRNGVSVYPLTTQVISESEWTPSVLERRQKILVSTLAREWRLVGN